MPLLWYCLTDSQLDDLQVGESSKEKITNPLKLQNVDWGQDSTNIQVPMHQQGVQDYSPAWQTVIHCKDPSQDMKRKAFPNSKAGLYKLVLTNNVDSMQNFEAWMKLFRTLRYNMGQMPRLGMGIVNKLK